MRIGLFYGNTKGGIKMDNEARRAYKAAYDKAMTRPFKFKFNIKTDADIITVMDLLPNKQKYIKELIRADIKTKTILQKHIGDGNV